MPRNKTATKPLLTDPSSTDVVDGLFNCYNFSTNNVCSDRTVGLPAFILRNTLANIDFSDIFNVYEEHTRQGKTTDFVALLEEKRRKLDGNEASIEKCLILTGLITFIQQNEIGFMTLVSNIQENVKRFMTDDQSAQMISYPKDFRQRERDFVQYRDAHNTRRLFYYPPIEAQAPSLIQLQNKITLHLSYIIDYKMRRDLSFRETGLEEIINILSTSFIIITQPHYNTSPVLVYDGKRAESPKANVSVIIISLLHDFIETHPKIIVLNDIEPILSSPSNEYRLAQSHKLSWKKCQLRKDPDKKPQTILYAKLSNIIIKKSSSKKKLAHLSEELYSLTFPITLNLNLSEHKISKCYQISLESLPFAICAHIDQIPHFLTKVIIDDIRRFSQLPSTSRTIETISSYIHRYFIHRTGVEPKKDLQDYLKNELKNAANARNNYDSLEDIYMDFLVPFVCRVEFMRKHPILAMWYENGLFLGPCNSEKVVEVMNKFAHVQSPMIALRFNSIKVDYTNNASTPPSKSTKADTSKSSAKPIKVYRCFVRVIIHTGRTKDPQNCTFSSKSFSADLLKFVSTAREEKARFIRILSTSDNETNSITCKNYDFFAEYFDDRLHEIFKIDSNYRDITNLFIDIDNITSDSQINENQDKNSSKISQSSIPSTSTTIINHTPVSNGIQVDYTNKTSTKNAFVPSDQELLQRINPNNIFQYALSNPLLCGELERYFRQFHISPTTAQQQQQSYIAQSQMYIPNQQTLVPFQQQASSSSVSFSSQYCSQPQSMLQSQQQLPSISSMFNPSTNDHLYQQPPVYQSNDNRNLLSQAQVIRIIPNDSVQTTNADNQEWADDDSSCFDQ